MSSRWYVGVVRQHTKKCSHADNEIIVPSLLRIIRAHYKYTHAILPIHDRRLYSYILVDIPKWSKYSTVYD